MSTPAGDVFKEFHSLTRNLKKLTDGQAQIELSDEDSDDSVLLLFRLTVSPNDGFYKGAAVNFKISVPDTYPNDPPNVECLHTVYHPNIDLPEGDTPASICVNLLSDDWEPTVGLDGCVIAILFLFHHPNLDDALSHLFSGSSIEEEEFAANVRASLKGEEVEGYQFDKIITNEYIHENSEENSDIERNSASTNDNSLENTQEGSNTHVTPVNNEASSVKIDLGSGLVEDTDSSLQEDIPTTTTTSVSSGVTVSEPKPLHSDDTIAPVCECEERNDLNNFNVNQNSTGGQTTLDIALPTEREARPQECHSYLRKIAAGCLQLFKILNPYQQLDSTYI